MIIFFFQAEDGIRDIGVTGVQTCALPIWRAFGKEHSNPPYRDTRQRMEECSLPKARPISCNDCPAFQRRHMSPFCAAESPNRFPWIINTTFENSVIPDGVASTA